jgi:hypothetical protein
MSTRKLGLLFTVVLALAIMAGVLAVAGVLNPLTSLAAEEPDLNDTLYVALDCTGLPTPCYTTVQDAVDAADDPGDTIQVAEGVYTGVHAEGPYSLMVYVTKTVTIRGGFSPDFSDWDPTAHPSVLDAQRQGHVFYIAGSASPVIEGLWVMRGDAEVGGGNYGGGILAIGDSGPELTVTLRYNHIISNYNPVGFGGGGGLAGIFSNVVLEDNRIEDNEATGVGGGARFEQSNLDLRDNIIRNNRTQASGGGMYLATLTSARLTNTVLIDNDASWAGGGMVASGAYVRMKHSTVARNSSGDGTGIYVTTGIYGSIVSTVLITNSIMVSQTVGLTVTSGPPGFTNHAILDSTLWDGYGQLVGGDGDYSSSNEYVGDPAFVADGYHLGPGSDAVDQGVNARVDDDIDDQPRPGGAGYDLGADELWFRIYLPVVQRGYAP